MKAIDLSPFHLEKKHHYDGLSTNANEAKWLLFGAPFDGSSSYRKGSKFAPDAIRKETLLCQESYSPYFDIDLADVSIADIGNLSFDSDQHSPVLNQIKTLSEAILEADKKLFMIGGEHLISLASIEAVFKKHPALRIIHIDAHADMADELFGEKFSHGTVMRRVHDFIGDKRIYQFGIRSGTRDELEFAKIHNIVNPFELSNYMLYLKEWEKYPIYLSIDLDGFDPSQIPATGTPETGGIFFREFIHFLRSISKLNFVGIDINELAPELDPSKMSTVFASKVIRETIAACLTTHQYEISNKGKALRNIT